MKTLYIECNMGAAGDMLMAALLELHPQPEAFLQTLNALGIPGVCVAREAAIKCGITGTHVSVRIAGHEEHSHDVTYGHDHAQAHEHGRPHDGKRRMHTHDDAHAHEHAHDDDPTHDHHHAHDDAHEHAHGSAHDHAHPHEHVHAQDHHHAPPHEQAPHSHAGLSDIAGLIGALPVSGQVKADALAVYALIAEAESHAHGKPVDAVHFHEVGAMDAVADIVGVCMLLEIIAPQQIAVSPVHVGEGFVRCAHGVLPVPAPATAHILRGVPTYGGDIRGELCTPTGAALLKHFAHAFGPRPLMTTQAIGYGMGKKDFPAANCVRVFLGDTEQRGDDIAELSCNLDDITGEALGFALDTLMDGGALDAYATPIYMKKNRPAYLLTCLCRPEDEQAMAALMLRHTTTFGVRSSRRSRFTLTREVHTQPTPYGDVRVKTGTGYGAAKRKIEYDDAARLARLHGIPLADILRVLDGGDA